ncbi:MAG TPA: pseudouridine synthase [Deltaproteobacteria bacterium]|nr:pseudouridine synthase [Deltaproteobacteria bacterium]
MGWRLWEACLTERLSKFLAVNGVASRRKAEAMIKHGLVNVNNHKIVDPYYQVDSEHDRVTVDGMPISRVPPEKVYIALNKPPGYISDLADPKGRPLARDLVPIDGRIYPVGRLDFASEGLILFTNDGSFADRVLHPRNEIEREYHVKLQRSLSPQEAEKFTIGRRIDGILYRVRSVQLLALTRKNAWYAIKATEGRNRMIRRIAESLGHAVLRLRRIRIGSVLLGKLRPGQYRHLTPREVQRLLGEGGQGQR